MKKVVVLGGGVAGLFLSLFLIKNKHQVHLVEKTSSLGKKFLVAGKSDLNITNDESLESFVNRYTPNFSKTFNLFSKDDFIQFLKDELGVETFVGTSGRVFPKEMRASKILNIIVNKLKENSNFSLSLKSTLLGFNNVTIRTSTGEFSDFDAAVFCLGGASWKVTGSDGGWRSIFEEAGVKISAFESSNCAIKLNLSKFFKDKVTHHHIKNVKLSSGSHRVQGDIVFNGDKLEGTPVYTMSRFFREGREVVFNFKPDLAPEKLSHLIEQRDKRKSVVNFLKSTLKLDPLIYTFWRESFSAEQISRNLFSLITEYKITSFKLADLDESISTIGGIDLDQVDEFYKLKAFKRFYAIGEMLNWDTITGGYLIQGCVSQAFVVSKVLS